MDGLYHVGTMQSGAGTTYISAHFNERNIIIDLKKEEDRELALKIAATADVIIENHPPGTMAKLQFDYESVRKVNPNIIYCASSSYGTSGPYANMPSNDPMMQLAARFCQPQRGAWQSGRNVPLRSFCRLYHQPQYSAGGAARADGEERHAAKGRR